MQFSKMFDFVFSSIADCLISASEMALEQMKAQLLLGTLNIRLGLK
jgi:hypothetical protein